MEEDRFQRERDLAKAFKVEDLREKEQMALLESLSILL